MIDWLMRPRVAAETLPFVAFVACVTGVALGYAVKREWAAVAVFAMLAVLGLVLAVAVERRERGRA
jgi:urea transporter